MMRLDYEGAEFGIICGPRALVTDCRSGPRAPLRCGEGHAGVGHQTQGTADYGSGSDWPHDEAG